VWQSTDPILDKYLPNTGMAGKQEQNHGGNELATLGGVFNSLNIDVYSYTHQNPLKYMDPDGRKLEFAKGSTPQFRQQIAQMVQYLNKGHASAVLAELQKRPETVYLKEGATLQDFYYDPNSKTIVVHPRSGLQVSPGKVQTPALGFLHEAGHALGDVKGTAASTAPIPGDPYDTKEEKRVIETIEVPAAKKLHEPIRHAHHGPEMEEKEVKCSTCDK